jgi:hypothetical protein
LPDAEAADLSHLHAQGALSAKVLSDPRYRKRLPELARFMRASREFRARPHELLQLQADMAGAVLALQKSQRELGTQLAEKSAGDGDGIADLNRAIAVCKRLAHVVKQTADGIAWRTLRHDRASMYQLALKNPAGHLDLESAARELAAAMAHADRTSDLVVMNDLTNFLRHGDFTCVGAAGEVVIAEVKAGRGSAKSGRATRQRHRLDDVLQLLRSGVRLTNEGAAALFGHKTKLRTHLQAVGDMIRQAKAQGSAHGRLSDCLAVDALHIPSLLEQGRTAELHDPFAQSTQARSFHSFTVLKGFARNVAPYSVYPFPDEDCTDLMTGDLWLWTHFNHGNLIRSLRRRGVIARYPTDTHMDSYEQLTLEERKRREDEVGIQVRRPGGRAILTSSPGLLARLIYEYLDEECFADCVEEMLDRGAAGVTMFPAFRDETELWD